MLQSWKKDPYLEYLESLSKTLPLTGWTLPDDEDYLIHDLLAFRYFSMFLREKKNQQDLYIFEFWNEVHDLREIEDVSCRLVRALSIIETYILSGAPFLIGLPQNQADALTAYYKKYAPIAEKIKQGGNIRQKDQSKVADPRPLFTTLQTHLFDRIKKSHWSAFSDSSYYSQWKKTEKKEIKKKDLLTSGSSSSTTISTMIVVPPLSSSISRYLTRSANTSEGGSGSSRSRDDSDLDNPRRSKIRDSDSSSSGVKSPMPTRTKDFPKDSSPTPSGNSPRHHPSHPGQKLTSQHPGSSPAIAIPSMFPSPNKKSASPSPSLESSAERRKGVPRSRDEERSHRKMKHSQGDLSSSVSSTSSRRGENSSEDSSANNDNSEGGNSSDFLYSPEEPELVEIKFNKEEINTKLVIERSAQKDVEGHWQHRMVFDFYVHRVLKKGRAPVFNYLLDIGLKTNDIKILIQLLGSLYKLTADLGLPDHLVNKLTKMYEAVYGMWSAGFGITAAPKRFEDEKGFKELLVSLYSDLQPKIQNYYPKFLTSRPHALYCHLNSLYTQIAGIMQWAKNAALTRNNVDDLQTSKKLCQYFLNFFDQFGVDDFYSKQSTKLKRELSELEQRMSIYCTLDAFINQLLPQILFHSLSYICSKSPSIRYVISLLKVILKGLRDDQAQSPVELPFIVKSTLCLGIPISPVHFAGLLEKKSIFGNKQNLGVLTTNCFFQYDHFANVSQTQSMTLSHTITSKRKILFDTITSVSFMRDKKGALIFPTGPNPSYGFTLDTGKELLSYDVSTKKDRALWILAFYSIRKSLVPEKIVEWLWEQIEENYENEDRLYAAMVDIITPSLLKDN